MTDTYTPYIPTGKFHYAATRTEFLKLFRETLEVMWANKANFCPPGDILTGMDPTFNIVTPNRIAEMVKRTRFPQELAKRVKKELGPSMQLTLHWDPLTPALLANLPSNMPPNLPAYMPLATPRPRIATTTVYFTKEEARAIGLPGHRL